MGMVASLTTRSNSAKKAYADEVQANSDTAQSTLDTFAGEQATTGSEIGAAGTLLSGASTVGTNYLKFQNQFAPSGSGPGLSLTGGVLNSTDNANLSADVNGIYMTALGTNVY
jgi:hypothetical protein